MKFSELTRLVLEYMSEQRDIAAYTGSKEFDGCKTTMDKYQTFRQELINKLDLRPSEYIQLGGIEVGEPEVFNYILGKRG